MKILIVFLSLVIQLFSQSIKAQKHFKVIVNLPQLVDPKSIEAWLDNGKVEKQIEPIRFGTRQLTFEGEYYSLYPALKLQNSPEERNVFFSKTFFIQDGLATIDFVDKTSSHNWYNEYELRNVLDFKKEQHEMYEYTTAERQRATEYESKYGEKLFIGSDTSIKNKYFNVLRPALERKKLQFVAENPESYFSFYTFRSDLAKPGITTWDSLLLVFNKFPEKFRYNDEGNYLNAYLNGQMALRDRIAIEFKVKDINNQTVSLNQFRGKKYVLLHFWATWCSPCISELPALKEIASEVSSKDFQIISVALPSARYEDFLKAIEKYQMNWIHIYNNQELVNRYGNTGTPRLYLVDKNGNLIYDKFGIGKNEDSQLVELKKVLKDLIKE